MLDWSKKFYAINKTYKVSASTSSSKEQWNKILTLNPSLGEFSRTIPTLQEVEDNRDNIVQSEFKKPYTEKQDYNEMEYVSDGISPPAVPVPEFSVTVDGSACAGQVMLFHFSFSHFCMHLSIAMPSDSSQIIIEPLTPGSFEYCYIYFPEPFYEQDYQFQATMIDQVTGIGGTALTPKATSPPEDSQKCPSLYGEFIVGESYPTPMCVIWDYRREQIADNIKDDFGNIATFPCPVAILSNFRSIFHQETPIGLIKEAEYVQPGTDPGWLVLWTIYGCNLEVGEDKNFSGWSPEGPGFISGHFPYGVQLIDGYVDGLMMRTQSWHEHRAFTRRTFTPSGGECHACGYFFTDSISQSLANAMLGDTSIFTGVNGGAKCVQMNSGFSGGDFFCNENTNRILWGEGKISDCFSLIRSGSFEVVKGLEHPADNSLLCTGSDARLTIPYFFYGNTQDSFIPAYTVTSDVTSYQVFISTLGTNDGGLSYNDSGLVRTTIDMENLSRNDELSDMIRDIIVSNGHYQISYKQWRGTYGS
jgi:hypothetical protein